MSTETAAQSVPAATNGDASVNAAQAEGRRLYIGNLAYATQEAELKSFFKEFLVESVSIPVNPRTSRPVGYAFVDLSTPSEAERAITELNGQSILERKVSIQLARRPEVQQEGGATSGGEGTTGEPRRRNSARGRGPRRGRGGRAARGDRKAGAETTATNGTAGPTNVPGQVDPLVETTKEALTTAQPSDAATMEVNPDKASKTRAPRERKQRGPPEDGVASKTKVMVANLPYDLREDRLMEIFKEYSPSSAKIALRPIPRFMVKKLQARNEPRKGRGFGFVTLGSEELQQKACAEMNGKEIEGREIAVKVAIDSPGKEDDDIIDGQAADAEATSDAPASGSVAPAVAA